MIVLALLSLLHPAARLARKKRRIERRLRDQGYSRNAARRVAADLCGGRRGEGQ